MSANPTRPGTEELDQEMKDILDQHREAAEKDKQRIPLRQLIEEGKKKLQHLTLK